MGERPMTAVPINACARTLQAECRAVSPTSSARHTAPRTPRPPRARRVRRRTWLVVLVLSLVSAVAVWV